MWTLSKLCKVFFPQVWRECGDSSKLCMEKLEGRDTFKCDRSHIEEWFKN
ncbi:hypothetical protein RchiOBHm_Chr2g0114701 [Rosa chinensis]|uniref:Uncharacterized protein n=1 Tax=Rosa chinensis TaxID=74649 RepID=A0A2P6RQX2_ROSCH|nr:hypothetical protein RchiOBHm_Chr2g0114701 [Rosa chinensis]